MVAPWRYEYTDEDIEEMALEDGVIHRRDLASFRRYQVACLRQAEEYYQKYGWQPHLVRWARDRMVYEEYCKHAPPNTSYLANNF